MKITVSLLFVGSLLLFTSCSNKGKRKSMPTGIPIETEITSTQPFEEVKEPEEPIREIEEVLVPIQEIPVNPSHYFVITGSFRNPDNAENFQKQLSSEGFVPVLLRNDAGLYRVSVLATDQIFQAREEILRIRSRYPKYNDVWLLIQKK
jgi:cell division protein FtsN